MRSENDIIDEMKTEACNQCRHEVLNNLAKELLAFTEAEHRRWANEIATGLMNHQQEQWRKWLIESNIHGFPGWEPGR